MRHYPSNSPQATARVLALALMADGAIDATELSILQQRDVLGRLGLGEDDFDRVEHDGDSPERGRFKDTGGALTVTPQSA